MKERTSKSLFLGIRVQISLSKQRKRTATDQEVTSLLDSRGGCLLYLARLVPDKVIETLDTEHDRRATREKIVDLSVNHSESVSAPIGSVFAL